MDMNFNWTCPYCNRDVIITGSNYSSNAHFFEKNNKYGPFALKTIVVTCPNEKCREYIIKGYLSKAEYITQFGSYREIGFPILEWHMRPSSQSKQFPDYIPKAIIADYGEACLIKDLSPKASATLSRRCLQGIIRGFWDVKKGKLADEIDAIKEKVDPITWEAIDSVRKIGNIGAHMEEDINLIIDVEPEEAQLLIGLIELLIKEWYIAKHERKKQLESIIAVANKKTEEKKNSK